jgi:hypothetical protein
MCTQKDLYLVHVEGEEGASKLFSDLAVQEANVKFVRYFQLQRRDRS